MKRILTTSLALAALLIVSAQSKHTQNAISVVSPRSDTLYLPDSDIGFLIAGCWKSEDGGTIPTPVIVFIPQERLDSMASMRRYRDAWKRHSRSIKSKKS